MATLQTLGKTTVLAALDAATLSMAIIDSTGAIIEAKLLSNGDFNFTSTSAGMTLDAPVTFTIPAGKIVTYVRIYATTPPTNNIAFLDYGVLPGTTAERTFTYAGLYTLSGYTITVA